MSRHSRPLGALVTVVIASLLAIGGATSAAVADDYPSWDEVQKARQNEAAAAAESDRIEGILVSLENTAAELGRAAQLKGEAYNTAREALDAASGKAQKLAAQAKDAAQQAALSSRRAGQLLAQAARAGGGSLSLGLLLSGDSEDLLGTLGTMSKLTEQSTLIYKQAIVDKNLAQSLTEQAKLAEATRKTLANDAQAALDAANAASDAIQAQITTQQAAADQLYAQLATLKGTTADVERRYIEGKTDPGPSNPGTPSNPGNPGTPSNPSPTTPPTTPPVVPPTPSPSAVEAAIAFATAQLGDSYAYGGSGPDSWDCSGLTKASYAAAGVYIGAHGATSQYNYLSGQGRLVPFSQIQRGDLIFYSSDGYTKYHTALYIGNGQMIEAQYEGVPVKISNVRYYDLVSYVARPTG